MAPAPKKNKTALAQFLLMLMVVVMVPLNRGKKKKQIQRNTFKTYCLLIRFTRLGELLHLRHHQRICYVCIPAKLENVIYETCLWTFGKLNWKFGNGFESKSIYHSLILRLTVLYLWRGSFSYQVSGKEKKKKKREINNSIFLKHTLSYFTVILFNAMLKVKWRTMFCAYLFYFFVILRRMFYKFYTIFFVCLCLAYSLLIISLSNIDLWSVLLLLKSCFSLKPVNTKHLI